MNGKYLGSVTLMFHIYVQKLNANQPYISLTGSLILKTFFDPEEVKNDF